MGPASGRSLVAVVSGTRTVGSLEPANVFLGFASCPWIKRRLYVPGWGGGGARPSEGVLDVAFGLGAGQQYVSKGWRHCRTTENSCVQFLCLGELSYVCPCDDRKLQ